MSAEGDIPKRGGEIDVGRVASDNRVEAALGKLEEGLARHHHQGICLGYELLCRATGSMTIEERFDLIDKVLGPGMRETVVLGFSRRQCFMCSDGTFDCDQCGGTGKDAGIGKCPTCDGLGFVPCDYCRGTGWTDVEIVPEQLRSVVMQERKDHILHSMIRLTRKKEHINRDEIRHLDTIAYRKLISWVMRMYARLIDFANSPTTKDEQERQRFLTHAENARSYVELLKQR